MATDSNTIKRADTIEAVIDEAIATYRGEFDRLSEVIGLNGVETVNAGTALYKYKVTGGLTDSATDPGTTVYEKTRDTSVVQGKTYYTRSGAGTAASPYTYSSVAEPTAAGLPDYYVAYASQGSSSGRSYVEGDEIALSHFKVEKVPLGEVNWIPYRFIVTNQAVARGGLQNAFHRIIDKARKQLRADTVGDFFGFLNTFASATVTRPASGTWNLQQLLAHADEALLNTMEDANESDSDIVHFVNRSDAYEYLAAANITTQELFGLTYLENFLGVNHVFLTNRITAGTVVATPVANIHIYGIDYSTINATDEGHAEYQVDDSGLIGISYDREPSRSGTGVYPVRSITIIPEVETFVVRACANPS